jgi:hypothetical protein
MLNVEGPHTAIYCGIQIKYMCIHSMGIDMTVWVSCVYSTQTTYSNILRDTNTIYEQSKCVDWHDRVCVMCVLHADRRQQYTAGYK